MFFVYGNPMLGNVYKKIPAISVDIKAMVTHQQSWWFCICGQSPMLPATPHAALVRSDTRKGLTPTGKLLMDSLSISIGAHTIYR